MKIEKNILDSHEAKLNVTVDAEEFQPFKEQGARKIAGSGKIAGFRPGKAPYDVVKRNYGELAIAQEALDIFLEKKYEEILKQADVVPGAMGRMEDLDQVNPPIFTLIIPLNAEVDLGDYRSVREDYVAPQLEDDEIEAALKELKTPYGTEEPTDGPAKDGDTVYTMLKADLNEPMVEGGTTELIKETPFSFVVGDDKSDNAAWPYPGFNKVLAGKKAEDVVETEYTFGDDAPVPSLKGKLAKFTATIQSVKNLILPEVDDEFIKNFGEYESVEKFMDALKDNMLREKIHNYDMQFHENVLGKVMDKASIKYAPAVLEAETKDVLDAFNARLARERIDLETYLRMKRSDMDKFMEEEIKPAAENQLKRRLVLQKFADLEKIQIDFEKFQQISMELQTYAAEQLKNLKNKKQKDALKSNITEQAFNETFAQSVIDRLSAIAKGENPEIEPTAKDAAVDAAVKDSENVVVDSNEVVEAPAKPVENASDETVVAEDDSKAEKKPAKKRTTKKETKETDAPTEEKPKATRTRKPKEEKPQE